MSPPPIATAGTPISAYAAPTIPGGARKRILRKSSIELIGSGNQPNASGPTGCNMKPLTFTPISVQRRS